MAGKMVVRMVELTENYSVVQREDWKAGKTAAMKENCSAAL